MPDLPQPMTPADCDLRDFVFMPLDVGRLRDSDLAANETPLMWLVYSRGYDIASLRQRETEVERELRLAREALASERMKNKVLVEALNGRQA